MRAGEFKGIEMAEKRITQNVIQCNHCKDVVVSMNRHDYKTCKCGRVAVDGGLVYLRRKGDPKTDYTEYSKWE